MEATDTVVSNADIAVTEQLHAMLSDLDDLDLPESEEIEVLETIEHHEELEADHMDELEAELTKAEVYAEAESGGEVIDDVTAVPEKPVKAAKPKRERKASGEKAKSLKVERDLSLLPPDAFVLNPHQVVNEALKEAVIALRPAQIKIAEKFDQTIIALHANRRPSRYVVMAFEALAATGEITSTDLIKTMTGSGLANGTAGSQVGQIMALFPILQIAERTGNTLKLNKESSMANKLRLALAA